MARRRLGLEIGALLAAKLVLLCGLYFLFFASDQREVIGAPAVSARLLGTLGK